MMKKITLVVVPLILAGCMFGSSKMMSPDATVASVDGRVISMANYDDAFKHLRNNANPDASIDSLKTVAIDSLVAQRLIEIRKDSIKQVLLEDPVFRQDMMEDLTQTIFKVLFEKQISSRIFIDTSEVTKFYVEHQDKYIEPEQLKAAHILIRRPKPDTAGVTASNRIRTLMDESDKFASERAEAVFRKARAGENWDTLAITYSEDANNSKTGGDLGYFFRGKMMPEFDSAAFAAEPGSIIGPVSTQYGYHIIRVDDYKPSGPRPFDPTLGTEIYGEMLNERERDLSNAFLDSIKTAGITGFNNDRIALDDSLIADNDWIVVVNSNDTLFGATYRNHLRKYKRWKQLDSLSVENKKEMFEMLLPTHLLRSAARTLGYMSDPEVIKMSDELVTIEANLRLSSLINETGYEPSEEEIARYFEAHARDYEETRPLLVHHILFQDSSLAEIVRDSIVAGADFTEMAKRYYPGDPEIREVLYNLDYIGPEEMGPGFFDAADTLKVGEVSHAFKTGWGYHIVKLVNRKMDKTLAQVRPGIKARLKEARNARKTAGLVAQWRQGAVIQIDQDAINKYKPEEKKVIRIEARATEQ
jgi:parvulin-like peptidyl-prolyl isomerase